MREAHGRPGRHVIVSGKIHCGDKPVSATVDRRTGKAQVLFEDRGAAGTLGDLHRAQHAGWWRWCMDASAVALAVGAVTGIVMWASLPRRRKVGLALLVLGTAATVGIYLLATR